MSLALYRKYRPGSFGELVGQEHVSEPLIQALTAGRTHHAYLFSGPRGCGKTSSARILARSLNCEKGPTPTPCGVCHSCESLSPNGAGSLDVIEIDAASHNGVDDARDLRERAFFAPVSSPFKIYIIDEAHMVTPQAFNALLKVVEEPPPHVCFIFATTEPERVLSTIKSRTFHYRFRLIAPGALREHLASICVSEGIDVDPLVLPLVVRAGAGSARDALSVLDQLAAGSAGKITYEAAIAGLGFTDSALLDEVVDAMAAVDGAAVFGSIDKVIEAGLDPRRFAQDLLERLRDLMVLEAVPDAGETGLLDCPEDVLERMRGQAARIGRAGLSRAADVMATALVDMRGTTSPRLVLELSAARILLPGASSDTAALLTRLDRLERRLAVAPGSIPESPAAAPVPAPAIAKPIAASEKSVAESATLHAPAKPVATAEPVVATPATEPVATAPAGQLDVAALRRLWPDILDAVKAKSKVGFSMLAEYAQIESLDSRTLTLSFSLASLARSFEDKADYLRDALKETVGLDVMIKAIAATPPASANSAPALPSYLPPAATASAPATAVEPDPTPIADDPNEPDLSGSTDVDVTESGASAQAAALALLQADLGAEVISSPDK